MGRWGKAGVRLTEAEARRNAFEAARRRRDREVRREEAYQDWVAGRVVPHRITLSLDFRGLQGPEVDAACKAREPEVDQWEAGIVYPRWDQLVALAELTGCEPGWFSQPVRPEDLVELHETSLWFHLSDAERQLYLRDDTQPVLAFPAEVVDARMRGEPSPLVPQHHGQLELF
ncbi:hypothetical protein [Saccharopolyspora griseoalba]|uniref:Uncharacterized protein n=1 Tax=Saccharopolyspora griseoalba TaxID=1431848 RepID=A0ABW2LRW1_9PSEU